MAFFDFLKGKNKETEVQEEIVQEEIVQEESLQKESLQKDILQAEGLTITPIEKPKDEDISLNISPDKRGMAAMNRAVHSALDVNEVNFKISAAGTLYGKDVDLDKEEEEEELEEVKEELEEVEEELKEEEPKKKGFFAKLAEGLGKTRKSILDNVDNVLGAFTKIDDDLFEELEEVLIMADLGVETTMNIIEKLKARVKKERATDPKLVKGLLIEVISAMLEDDEVAAENLPSPTVMLVIGVNGVGKTTTIGKLAKNFKEQGKTVLLAAADTFRAAAIEQLEVWGKRADIEVIKQQENSDPAAVVFDAVNAAKHRKTDLLICDTAGRLHNKKNLMEELKKIAKVIEREFPEAHKEIYLVLDATTGQNALQQAKLFKEAADITGIILTKLDGTAKGGIVIAIKSELNIPVRYIGVGEGIADLQEFEPKAFAKALFSEGE